MRLASFSTLLLASVLAGPALWHGFVARDLDSTTALLRYLIAIPVAAIMIAVLRSIVTGYQRDGEREPLRVRAVTGEPMAQRRSTDQADPTGEPAVRRPGAVEPPGKSGRPG